MWQADDISPCHESIMQTPLIFLWIFLGIPVATKYDLIPIVISILIGQFQSNVWRGWALPFGRDTPYKALIAFPSLGRRLAIKAFL